LNGDSGLAKTITTTVLGSLPNPHSTQDKKAVNNPGTANPGKAVGWLPAPELRRQDQDQDQDHHLAIHNQECTGADTISDGG